MQNMSPIPMPSLRGIPRLEFAAMVGKDVRTVDRWIRRGAVNSYKLGGGVYVMPPDENMMCQRRADR